MTLKFIHTFALPVPLEEASAYAEVPCCLHGSAGAGTAGSEGGKGVLVTASFDKSVRFWSLPVRPTLPHA